MEIKAIILLREPTITDDALLSGRIELGETYYSAEALRGQYNNVIALLVLHWYIIADREGNSGYLSAKKEGQLSVSFSGSTEDKNIAYNSTAYGAEMLVSIRSMGASPIIRDLS